MGSTCTQCEKPKASLSCGICQASVCKACAQYADEDAVALLEPKPEHFAHGVFCLSCFQEKVEPQLSSYNEVLSRAEKVDVFYKSESKESRFIRRVEKQIRVDNCADHADVVMKLAFTAARLGFNLLLDVETSAKKVYTSGRWKTSNWQGVAVPGHIDSDRLNRRFIGTPN